jgi:hypothetical protein
MASKPHRRGRGIVDGIETDLRMPKAQALFSARGGLKVSTPSAEPGREALRHLAWEAVRHPMRTKVPKKVGLVMDRPEMQCSATCGSIRPWCRQRASCPRSHSGAAVFRVAREIAITASACDRPASVQRLQKPGRRMAEGRLLQNLSRIAHLELEWRGPGRGVPPWLSEGALGLGLCISYRNGPCVFQIGLLILGSTLNLLTATHRQQNDDGDGERQERRHGE